MFDFAWSELALIGVVALLVIGPKDLPRAMRTVGFWVRKARSIAHEFQGSLEQMMREAELDEVKRQVDKATSFNFDEEFAKTIDPKGELKSALNDPVLANPLAETAKPDAPPAVEPPPQGELPLLSQPPAAPALPPPQAEAHPRGETEPALAASVPPHTGDGR